MHVLSLNFFPSISLSRPVLKLRTMSEEQNGKLEGRAWPKLKLPDLLFTDTVRKLHEAIESEWDSLLRSACQTVAGRDLWKHVTSDQLAELLAGETYLRSLYEKIRERPLQ